ncbi:phosphoglycerate kinase [Candidatus Saccharibacteria bacterium]|nr:phosphoglycerate kinase [Candidatus Saccharibacteria bacterium]
MKTIRNLDLKDKTILMRVDYNVPLKNGKVADDLRIRSSLPTINYLLEKGAKKIILLSHLGRPDGQENLEFSLSPVADTLRKLLPEQKHIGFYPLPEKGKSIIDYYDKPDLKVILLENLRFDPGEEANSPEFIKNIIDSTGANIYVQDGFAVVHRAHASTDAVAKFLPIYTGFLVEKEAENLTKVLENPEHPVLLIIGGSKVDDKQPLIDKFSTIADQIFVGGKIAADGYKANNPKIYVSEDFDEDASGAKLDIGPVSTAKLADYVKDAKTIIWNGLLGKAEDPAYATASTIAAKLVGEKEDATTIICGGDTTGFVENLMKDNKDLSYSLISTGGGAALEFLVGKELPGLKVIKRA